MFRPPRPQGLHVTKWKKAHLYSAPTLLGPNATAQGLVSTAHSPKDHSEHSPTIQHHGSLKRGSLGSTAGGDEEQGPGPKEQVREKAPGESQDKMWHPSYGVKAALWEVLPLAVTDPGYRAIPKVRTSSRCASLVQASWQR